jgi:hypothetical protein
MRKAILAGSACALLAACGGAEEDAASGAGDTAAAGGAISSEEVIERAREGTVRPLPGLYRSQVELVDLDIPGAPPQAAEMMRGQMAQTNEFCLTEEDVEEGYRRMASQPQGDNCSFTRFDVDGGEIDAVMSCSNPGGGAVDITMQGTGGETSSEFTMRMAGDFGGAGKGSMTMKQSSERIGDCPAG